MLDTFIGVVQGDVEGSIALGVLSPEKGVAAHSFTVAKGDCEDFFAGRDALMWTEDLLEILHFLDWNAPGPDRARVLLEAPEVGRISKDVEAIGALCDIDSALLRTIAVLAVMGYIVCRATVLSELSAVLLQPIGDEPELVHLRPRQSLYLPTGIARAYRELLFPSRQSPEHDAITAALLARNQGAFHYWASRGTPPSSHDVVEFLRTGQRGYGTVYSGPELFRLCFRKTTRRNDIDGVPLEYALTAQRYQHLGRNVAMKAALLYVCIVWDIGLMCQSFVADADNDQPAVYPLAADDTWVAAGQYTS
jgi:hypothetical protein